MSSHILLRSGKFFDPLNPTSSGINLTDIAHGLSNICRFTGQCVRFYSVAQHSLLVVVMLKHVDRMVYESIPGQALALFHDAAEAYLGDTASPLKRSPAWAAYRQYEDNLQEMIERKYLVGDLGLSQDDLDYARDAVKAADDLAFVFEAQHLMGKDFSQMLLPGITVPDRQDFKPWNPPRAKRQWLEHYVLLGQERARHTSRKP